MQASEYTSSNPGPPRPSWATVLHSAWFGPVVLAGAVLILMGLLVVKVDRSSHQSAVDQIRASGSGVRESVRRRLTATTEYFLMLAEGYDRKTLDESWLRDRAAHYATEHPELLTVMQVNREGDIRWCADGVWGSDSPRSDAQNHLVAPVRDTIASAMWTSQVLCSMPYQGAQDEVVMVMVVPLKRQGRNVGALVSVYSWDRLLRQSVRPDVFEQIQIGLVDEHRNVFLTCSTGEQVDTRLFYMEMLPSPLPHRQLYLTFVPYGTGFWTVPQSLLMLLPAGLVLGMAWGMWGLKRQVAERRQAESALRQARDELERRVSRRTADLENANAQLQQEMAQRRQAELYIRRRQEHLWHVGRVSTMAEMAAGLAHELNQPLGSIGSYADGCMRMIEGGQADSVELRSAISEIGDQIRRVGHIIHRLRRLVSEGGELELARSDIKRLVGQVVNLVLPSIRQQEVHLSLEIEKDLPPVMVDSIQIQQVLLNLMKNAVEAMSTNTESEVRVLVVQVHRRVVEGAMKVELVVTDTGPGCSPAMLPRIFDAFFTTKKGGMGMGLSVSRTIVEAHGGKLVVQTNTPRGLIMRFILDAAEARPDAPLRQPDRANRGRIPV